MKTIGLTGGIASGKSTVISTLRLWGAVVLDADEIAHQLMDKGQTNWHRIVEEFGESILLPNQSINRIALGEIIFRDEAARLRLNALTHPVILEDIKDRLHQLAAENQQGIAFVEVPLLFECAWESQFDEIWTVWVDPQTQLDRLMARNELDQEAAYLRIASQMSLDEKARRSDRIIDNSGSQEETFTQTRKNYQAIL